MGAGQESRGFRSSSGWHDPAGGREVLVLRQEGARRSPGPRLQPARELTYAVLHHQAPGDRGAHPGPGVDLRLHPAEAARSEEHTSELQSLMRISYAVF